MCFVRSPAVGLYRGVFHGPLPSGLKVRLSRRLGVAIADLPKHNKAEFVAPGMHGARSQRLSEYGIRMREKQRLKAHYSVLEKQFRRYMEAAKKAKGNTAVTLQQLLELRLDNVVRRLGVVRSIWAARQLVSHGHVKYQDGKSVDIPSFSVDSKLGDHLQGKSRQAAPRKHGKPRRPPGSGVVGVQSRPARSPRDRDSGAGADSV